MSLTPGTRLGAYDVTAQIGAGGMGEVYRARDTKLNRDVALKVLPDAFANDSERLARFQREAQVLAALNHPNIAHIHGLEESDPSTHSAGPGQAVVHAIVMELVEGETLAERIAKGSPQPSRGLPLDEALAIARQIADALEAAHEQGIIHRDPGKPTVFLNTSFEEHEPMFSPDGRWLAYSSNESGREEMDVRPFPGPGGRWLVSTGGGDHSTWSRTKHELFYCSQRTDHGRSLCR